METNYQSSRRRFTKAGGIVIAALGIYDLAQFTPKV
jgi:hypothetical protein